MKGPLLLKIGAAVLAVGAIGVGAGLALQSDEPPPAPGPDVVRATPSPEPTLDAKAPACFDEKDQSDIPASIRRVWAKAQPTITGIFEVTDPRPIRCRFELPISRFMSLTKPVSCERAASGPLIHQGEFLTSPNETPPSFELVLGGTFSKELRPAEQFALNASAALFDGPGDYDLYGTEGGGGAVTSVSWADGQVLGTDIEGTTDLVLHVNEDGSGRFEFESENRNLPTAESFNGSVEWICSDGKPHVAMLPSSLDGALGSAQDIGALDFGNVTVGASSGVQQLAIYNGGDGVLAIDTFKVGDNFSVPDEFDGCSGETLPEAESCLVGVVFDPKSPGPVTEELSFSDDRGNDFYAALGGTALTLGNAQEGLRSRTPLEAQLAAVPSESSLRETPLDCAGKFFGWQRIGRSDAPVRMQGQVVQAHITTEDALFNHFNIDQNFFVYPDARYRHLLARPGNFAEGDPVEFGRIEVEWESAPRGVAPPFTGGIPGWAWPALGDRVLVIGNHIFDCGHGHTIDPKALRLGEGLRSEIHPPRLVVSYRNAGLAPFNGTSGRMGSFADFGDGPAWASQADVFASTYGGLAMTSIDGTLPTKAAKTLNEGWWQRTNDRDYRFIVKAPPKPTPDAQLTNKVVMHPVEGVVETPELDLKQLPDGDAYEATIGFSDVKVEEEQLSAIGASIYVGWKKSPEWYRPVIRHYTVQLEKLHVTKELSEQWSLYGFVNRTGMQLLAGGGRSGLHEDYRVVHAPATITDFVNDGRFEVDLVNGEPLQIQFRGIGHRLFFGDNFLGGIVNFTLRPGEKNPGSVLQNGSQMDPGGREEMAKKCQDGSCFTVLFSITGG